MYCTYNLTSFITEEQKSQFLHFQNAPTTACSKERFPHCIKVNVLVWGEFSRMLCLRSLEDQWTSTRSSNVQTCFGGTQYCQQKSRWKKEERKKWEKEMLESVRGVVGNQEVPTTLKIPKTSPWSWLVFWSFFQRKSAATAAVAAEVAALANSLSLTWVQGSASTGRPSWPHIHFLTHTRPSHIAQGPDILPPPWQLYGPSRWWVAPTACVVSRARSRDGGGRLVVPHNVPLHSAAHYFQVAVRQVKKKTRRSKSERVADCAPHSRNCS